jgi:siroheme synthase-like protein
MKTENSLFPIFLRLDKLTILLIGGGEVAYEKLTAVLKCYQNATIKLVAKNISEEVRQLATSALNVSICEKELDLSDFNDQRLIIAATGNNELNKMIYREARYRNIPVNIADKPELCDFYLGSIVSKGDLRMAISTNGKSPALAKKLREYFESNLPDELEDVISNLGVIRKKLQGNFKEKVRKLRAITSVLD